MTYNEQAHDYHKVKEMYQYLDLFLEHQVPTILPWHLLAAQCRWESGFYPRAVSSAGAKGLAQFMDATWAGIGHGDPFNPKDAIPAQSRYMLNLAMLHGKTCQTTPWWWIVSYTWGFGNVQRMQSRFDIPDAVVKHADMVIETSEYYCDLLSYTDYRDR